jgi:hypothetical protein
MLIRLMNTFRSSIETSLIPIEIAVGSQCVQEQSLLVQRAERSLLCVYVGVFSVSLEIHLREGMDRVC